MPSTPNLGLTSWTVDDYFSHIQLANNWSIIDDHDHSSGKGKQIGSGGIAPLAIGSAQIQDGAIISSKLGSNSITGDRIQDGSLPAGKITSASINTIQIGSLPQCLAYSGSAFAVPSASASAISFTNATAAPSSIWQVATPTRLIVPVSGFYFISGFVTWASSASGTLRRLQIRRNATDIIAGSDVAPFVNLLQQSVSSAFYLNPSDYIELIAYQDSGGSLNLTIPANYEAPQFRLVWLSA